MKVTNAKDIKMPPLNLLVYGEPGVGKTYMLKTAVKPALVLDAEGGTLTLMGSDTDILKINSPEDIRDAFKELKNGAGYKTVCFDSITEVYKCFMDEIIKKNPNIARAYGDQPSLSDYGRASELMRRTIRQFRDLPIHFIATALVQDLKDEKDGSLTRLPSLPGKLAYEVAGYMDVVGYVFANENKETGDVERGVLVQPRGTIIAKDRSGKLGQVVEPDVSGWIKIINGKGGGKK